ncbi:hypothetical protein N1851_009151 [Merluccius polli]|uniref:Uncharacterized protein n=1 Tax=Merluccius polli TaxID=89951 RepID=A0AA47N0M8_MERPO|nr:hypothetical protein N1851_009151 [Merluccius polli]
MPSLTSQIKWFAFLSSVSGQVTCKVSDNSELARVERYPQLLTVLPPRYEYHVCAYEERSTEHDHTHFEATLRVGVTTVTGLKEWLTKTKETSVMWRVSTTRPRTGERVLFKADYKCQHHVSIAETKGKSKNTCCPARMNVTLVRCITEQGRVSRSKDPHLPLYPMLVRIRQVHNHHIYVGAALKHRDVGEEAINGLKRLFEIGHSPSTALAVLKRDLLAEFGEQYESVSANRAICPDLHFCYRLYDKVYKEEFAAQRDQAISACANAELSGRQLDACDKETLHLPDNTPVKEMAHEMLQLTQDGYFNPGLMAMAKQYHQIKSDPSLLLSSFHCFGKTGRAVRRRRPGPMVACQPTALAWRITHAGSGKPKIHHGGPEPEAEGVLNY